MSAALIHYSIMGNTRLNVALVALAVAFFTGHQILWSTQLLCDNNLLGTPPPQNNNNNVANDIRMAKFNRLKSPPSNIYVLGERNSGTNYAAATLRKAFNPPNNVSNPALSHEYFSADIPVLKHKHMFRHTLLNDTELAEIANRTDILWILVVRSPCEWAEAMKRLPWHVCMPNDITSECPGAKFVGFEHKEDLKKYTLSEFFNMEWGGEYPRNRPYNHCHDTLSHFTLHTCYFKDWPESTNFRNLSFVGKDFVYRNIFQLRRHKLMLMKQIIDTVPRHVKILRLHELERSPEIFIQVR